MNQWADKSVADFKRLSNQALLGVFMALEAFPTLEEMHGEYNATSLKQPSMLAALSTIFTVNNPLMPWVGKCFRPVDEKKGRGYNLFRRLGKPVQRYPMETFIAPSRYDGKPVYTLVYRAFYSGCGTIHMVDEVRSLSRGFYLGIGTWGYSAAQRLIAYPFLLQGPVADYRGDIGRRREDYRPELEVPALAGQKS